jgi:acyl-homoserine lactone acylase PvdQ
MLQYFLSFDWFLELTRQRLTEIYDKELVDRMLPFKQKDYFWNDTHLIKDDELSDAYKNEEGHDIYEVDEDLLYFRDNSQPRQKKMNHFEHESWHQEEFIAHPGGVGSNCWTVSGKHTVSGKPYLACDPHLNKQMQSMFFLSAMSWKNNTNYIIGGQVPGIPVFTYGRGPSYAWGATALNPDNTDLYVEKVEGEKYFFDGEWYDFRVEKETFKVRG